MLLVSYLLVNKINKITKKDKWHSQRLLQLVLVQRKPSRWMVLSVINNEFGGNLTVTGHVQWCLNL